MIHFRKKTAITIAAVIVFLVLAEVTYQVTKPSKTTYSLTLYDLIHGQSETNGETGGGGGADGENGGGGNNGNTRRCCSWFRSGRCNTSTFSSNVTCPPVTIYTRIYTRNNRQRGVGVSTNAVSFTMLSGRRTNAYTQTERIRPAYNSRIVTCPTDGDCNICTRSDGCAPFVN